MTEPKDPRPCADCGATTAFRRVSRDNSFFYVCDPCDLEHKTCRGCGTRSNRLARTSEGLRLCEGCKREAIAASRLDAEVAVIVGAVLTVEPQLAEADVLAALEVATVTTGPSVTTRRRRELAAVLEATPECLTEPSASVPPVYDRFVTELRRLGAVRLSMPVCGSCGRSDVALLAKPEGRRCYVCSAPREKCARCGEVRRVARRLPDGRSWCDACRRTDPSTHRRCDDCGEPRYITSRRDGVARCSGCDGRERALRRQKKVCSRCGQRTPLVGSNGDRVCAQCRGPLLRSCSRCGRSKPTCAIWANGPVCGPCYRVILDSKGTCERCGDRRRIDPRYAGPEALCSDCAELPSLFRCERCGDECAPRRRGRCASCVLAETLQELLAGSDGTIRPELAGFEAALRTAAMPRSVLGWLHTQEVHDILRVIADAGFPLTHQAIDEFGTTKLVEHVRLLLVASGALPHRNDILGRLERWVDEQLAEVDNGDDRKVLTAFATWWLLRRRRNKLVRQPRAIAHADHTKLKRAIEFLAWLRRQDVSLAGCTQADVERWLVTGPSARVHARSFLRWAHKHRLCADLMIPNRPKALPLQTVDVREFAPLARRLLHDDEIVLMDRVAALLVLLYGQPVSRVARLRLQQIGHNGATTTIRFGSTDVELLEPLGHLVRQLIDDPPQFTPVDHGEAVWLFPGKEPGLPLSAGAISRHLNRLGLRALDARTALLYELAGDLIPSAIADTLGLHVTTVMRWVHASSANWTAYAAERSRTPRAVEHSSSLNL